MKGNIFRIIIKIFHYIKESFYNLIFKCNQKIINYLKSLKIRFSNYLANLKTKFISPKPVNQDVFKECLIFKHSRNPAAHEEFLSKFKTDQNYVKELQRIYLRDAKRIEFAIYCSRRDRRFVLNKKDPFLFKIKIYFEYFFSGDDWYARIKRALFISSILWIVGLIFPLPKTLLYKSLKILFRKWFPADEFPALPPPSPITGVMDMEEKWGRQQHYQIIFFQFVWFIPGLSLFLLGLYSNLDEQVALDMARGVGHWIVLAYSIVAPFIFAGYVNFEELWEGLEFVLSLPRRFFDVCCPRHWLTNKIQWARGWNQHNIDIMMSFYKRQQEFIKLKREIVDSCRRMQSRPTDEGIAELASRYIKSNPPDEPEPETPEQAHFKQVARQLHREIRLHCKRRGYFYKYPPEYYE